MTEQIKKRFRTLLREEFEKKFTKNLESTKLMYAMIGVMDSVIDRLEYEDLLYPEEVDKIKTMRSLIGDIMDKPKKGDEFWFSLRGHSGEVNMIVKFE